MKKIFFLVAFIIPTFLAAQTAKDLLKSDTDTLIVVEQMPEFFGGNTALKDFLQENIKYPEEAHKLKIEGNVYVSFIIDKEGAVSDIKILRGVNPYLDKEAIRVVKLMPKWKSGKQNGKSVNVQYNLPIRFSIDKK